MNINIWILDGFSVNVDPNGAYEWATAPQKSRYEIAKSRAINTRHLVEEKE